MKTPAANLEKYDHLDAADAVINAWLDPGDNPVWHRVMQKELHETMPLLARAIERLVEEY
jgi:hypothetical protein